MITLLDERNGLLMTADGFNLGPIYCHFPDCDLDALATTARRYAELAGDVQLIVCHHSGRVVAEPGLLRSYAEDVERVQAGAIALTPGRDILGDPYLEARFDHYSITLPEPATEREAWSCMSLTATGAKTRASARESTGANRGVRARVLSRQ
jgi:hypothetical protein